MRTSQKALLGVFGFLLLLVVVLVVSGRMVIDTLSSGSYEERRPAIPAVVNGTSANFALRDFTGIDARGAWDIELVRGDEFAVNVTFPEDAADRLDVRVQGPKLMLGYRRGPSRWFGRSDEHYTAHVTMPNLESIDIAGTSNIDLDGFAGDQLRFIVSGAAGVEARGGHYDSLTLIVSGAGDVDLHDMPVVDAQVVLSGAGEIELTMDGGALTGTVSGAGKVRYHGTVSKQSLIMSGFSSAEHVD